MRAFIDTLELPAAEKKRLLALTPASYTGMAAELARAASERGRAVPRPQERGWR